MALPARSVDRPTTLTRWDPFREIEDTWARMGSLLGDVMAPVVRPGGVLGIVGMPVDIEETDDAYIVEFDLPGVRREDVSVDLRENELEITGEIKERERTGMLRRQTRPVGRFEHRVSLPGQVDPESVSASLADGVLTVQLAKSSRSQARHIEIGGEVSGERRGERSGEQSSEIRG